MKSILCATKFSYLHERLYFQNEVEGAIGYVDILNGRVHFIENLPTMLVDIDTRKGIMYSFQHKVLAICNKGRSIYEISLNDNIYDIIPTNNGTQENMEWAGIFNYHDKIYAFGRKNGFILKINLETKQVIFDNTGILDMLMWVVNFENFIYGVSWNCKYMYKYNLDTKQVERFNIKIPKQIQFESNTSMPLHGMQIIDGIIYMHDKKLVLKFDISTKKTNILYENEYGNNGSRIVILDNSIIIPTVEQTQFLIIDKQSGRVREIRKLPQNIKIVPGWKGSGEPCYAEKIVYLPIINSDRVLCIKRDTLDFDWLQLKFDNTNIDKVMQNMLKQAILLKEGFVLNLKEYINNI